MFEFNFNSIAMDLGLAFNPLYIVPIVAVILCAVIVYSFGFKTPAQPPSFEGIEDEKKVSKKRKAKDNLKAKNIQNGKPNAVSKAHNISTRENKKREVAEKHVYSSQIDNDIVIGNVKTTSSVDKVEKKVAKRTRLQVRLEKTTQEKKGQSVAPDDINDDGWVQLVSKKGRKNRKKDDSSSVGKQSNAGNVHLDKAVPETDNKLGNSCQNDIAIDVSDGPAVDSELKEQAVTKLLSQAIISKEKEDETINMSSSQKAHAPKEDGPKENIPPVEKNEDELVSLKVPNPSLAIPAKYSKEIKENMEQNIESTGNYDNAKEGKPKSKKKKKKSPEPDPPKDSSESPVEQVLPEIPMLHVKTSDITLTFDTVKVDSSDKPNIEQSDIKSTNVAFDELAEFFPDAKDQRKKKKVRRDH